MGPNVNKCACLGIPGGGGGGAGWPINNQTGPILLPSYPLTYIKMSIYKIWKQSDKDFLSYRVHKEMSADAA